MKKNFDCVQLQREVREKLATRYPKSKERDLLAELRKEFGGTVRQKARQ